MCLAQKKKPQLLRLRSQLGDPLTVELSNLVAKGGIEPPTRGFSIRCSTN
jgi:hypothetical protein